MRGGVFSKNIWGGGSERRNENIIVSGLFITFAAKSEIELKNRFTLKLLNILIKIEKIFCLNHHEKRNNKLIRKKFFYLF